MSKIIIGIHGLGNKPPKRILEKWWRKAIREGLKRSGHYRLFVPFEMVYWADIISAAPLNPKEKNKENEFYIKEPYIPSQKEIVEKPNALRKKILDYMEKQLDKIFLNDDLSVNYSFVSDFIIHHFFKELDLYYSPEKKDASIPHHSIRDAIHRRLVEVLEKHKENEILFIAHSMGSIIAYDVLTQKVPDIPIDTLVTMGSPLGVPAIMGKIASDQKKGVEEKNVARTPENVVRNWYNFSDLEDKIAFNYNLGDDYQENLHTVRAIDTVVYNNYEVNGERNPHKSYGYLRTPELAKVIDAFLNRGKSKLMIWLTDRLGTLLVKF